MCIAFQLGSEFEKIIVGSNSITLHVRFSNLTADMINEEFINALPEFGAQLKRNTHTPSSVSLNFVIYDKYHNRL